MFGACLISGSSSPFAHLTVMHLGRSGASRYMQAYRWGSLPDAEVDLQPFGSCVSNSDGPHSDLDLSLDGYFEVGAEEIDMVRAVVKSAS